MRTSRAALTLAALALIYGLVRLGAQAVLAFDYPYGLDYGEGVIWQQTLRIVAGTGYAPLGDLPAFVFQYPPLYHLTAAGTAALLGMDQLYAGRLVSFVATLVSAGFIGLLTARALGSEGRPIRTIAGLFAGAAFASLPLLLTSALLMQIDTLALAFTLAGLLCATGAVARPRLAVAAGVLFAAALYTRQTSLPAPIAAFVILWLVRPRAAWTMFGAAVATCVLALAALWLTGAHDFLRQITAYNINRIAWDHAAKLGAVLLANIVPIALAGIGCAVAWRRVDPRNWRALKDRLAVEPGLAATATILLMLAIKTPMLAMILKSGANDNYLIDWFAGLAVMIGIAVAPVVRAATGPSSSPSIVLLALLGVGLPVHMLSPPLLPDFAAAARERSALDMLVRRVRASPKPVVSDDMVLLLRAGQPVIWEPAIIAELGSAGRYPDAALAARVRRGEFGFFATHGARGTLMYDQRFTPAVADAIDATYPRREQVGELTLHLPRD